MEGRKAPGRVIYPCPAPGFYPSPLAVAVGRPIVYRNPWIPDGTIVGVLIPVAIRIQLLISGDAWRHIPRRCGALVQGVARSHPLIKGVSVGNAPPGRDCKRAPCNDQLLACVDAYRLASVAVDCAAAAEHGYACRVRAGVDVKAEFTGLIDHPGQVGRAYFKAFALLQIAYTGGERAVGEGQAGSVVIQLGNFQIRLACEPEGRPATVQFSS